MVRPARKTADQMMSPTDQGHKLAASTPVVSRRPLNRDQQVQQVVVAVAGGSSRRPT